MNNIYLVGFMGTGKSAAGRLLAKRLKVKFLDLDGLIEKGQKRKITDIFTKEGEACFRKLEKQALGCVSKDKNLVVACGGGIVLDRANIELMRSTGKMVCLCARPEVILDRVKHYRHRPLLNVEDKENKIEEILSARQPLYDLSDVTIDTSDLTVDEVVKKILSYLKA